MYESFFGLNEPAFSISPNPKFFYMSIHHKQALSMLKRGIADSGGFLLFTGEVGTGKTVILRKILNELPDNIEKAVIYNPKMSVNEVLEKICLEFGITIPKYFTKRELVDAISVYITGLHEQGKKAIIVIDEAQHLEDECIEEVRLLTNIETDNTKLLQVILVGQPELKEKLNQVHMRQISQRITGRFHLLPLTLEELDAYVRFRMQAAGCVQIVFSNQAIKELHKASNGIPRIVNVISDKALNQAFEAKSSRVEKEHMKVAISEALGNTDSSSFNKPSLMSEISLVDKFNFLKKYIAQWGIFVCFLLSCSVAGYFIANLCFGISAQTLKDNVIQIIKSDKDFVKRIQFIKEVNGNKELIESFNRELARYKADLSNNTFVESAWGNLLNEWGFANMGSSIEEDCTTLMTKGFKCYRGKGSISDLERYNVPAIIQLMDKKLNTFYVVLIQLSDEYATVLINGREWTFYRSYIEQSMEGDIILIWPLPYGLTNINSNSYPGAQKELAFMLDRFYNKEEIFTGWNKEFVNRVKDFQSSMGLKVDGIAGVDTLWALLPYADTGRDLFVSNINVDDQYGKIKEIYGNSMYKSINAELSENQDDILNSEELEEQAKQKQFNANIEFEDIE